MAIANIHIPADITRTNYNRLMTMKQGDKNSRNLVIQLYEGGKSFPIESGASVCLNVKRPDGNVVQAVGSVNADGTVSAMLPVEALLIAGTIRISVSIFGANSAILTSTTIIMDVQEAEDVSEDITVFRSSGSTAAGNYYIIVAGTPYAFTTTSAVPNNGTIAFSADLTEANTYNASGAAIETGLTLTAGSTTGTQLIAGPVATLIDSILAKMSGKQDALTAGTGITLVNNVISATGGEGLSNDVKAALLACFSNVAWVNENGMQYYNDLFDALYPIVSITASFDAGGNLIYSDDTLNDLKQFITVTGIYEDGSTTTIEDYTLSGTISAPSSEITITVNGKTATVTVPVHTVGTTNYADTLNHWIFPIGRGSYANNKLTLHGTQEQGDNYDIWTLDRAKTLWSTVLHKKLRCRITLNSPDWSGELSTHNRTLLSVAIYKNASITAGSERQKWSSSVAVACASEPKVHTFIFDAELENMTGGTGTPTSASTFGLAVYNVNEHTINITSAEIKEILD